MQQLDELTLPEDIQTDFSIQTACLCLAEIARDSTAQLRKLISNAALDLTPKTDALGVGLPLFAIYAPNEAVLKQAKLQGTKDTAVIGEGVSARRFEIDKDQQVVAAHENDGVYCKIKDGKAYFSVGANKPEIVIPNASSLVVNEDGTFEVKLQNGKCIRRGNDKTLVIVTAEGKPELSCLDNGATIQYDKSGTPVLLRNSKGALSRLEWSNGELIGISQNGQQILGQDGRSVDVVFPTSCRFVKEGKQWINAESGEVFDGDIKLSGDHKDVTFERSGGETREFKSGGEELARDAHGRIRELADKFGRITKYADFDDKGNPGFIKESDGSVWKKTKHVDGVNIWICQQTREEKRINLLLDHKTGMRTEISESGTQVDINPDGLTKTTCGKVVCLEEMLVPPSQFNTGTKLVQDGNKNPTRLVHGESVHKFDVEVRSGSTKGAVVYVSAPNCNLRLWDAGQTILENFKAKGKADALLATDSGAKAVETWRIIRSKSIEEIRGRFEMLGDGSYRIAGEGRAEFRVFPNGAIIKRDVEGRITDCSNAKGESHLFEYDKNGAISTYHHPVYGKFQRAEDGLLKSATVNGQPLAGGMHAEVDSQGTVTLNGAAGYEQHLSNGAIRVHDDYASPPRAARTSDGEMIHYDVTGKIDDNGLFPVKVREAREGARIHYNEKGLMYKMVLPNGRAIDVTYAPDGSVQAFSDGKNLFVLDHQQDNCPLWKNVRGQNFPFHGIVSWDESSRSLVITNADEGTTTRIRPDGLREVSRLYKDNREGFRILDQQNRVVETGSRDGRFNAKLTYSGDSSEPATLNMTLDGKTLKLQPPASSPFGILAPVFTPMVDAEGNPYKCKFDHEHNELIIVGVNKTEFVGEDGVLTTVARSSIDHLEAKLPHRERNLEEELRRISRGISLRSEWREAISTANPHELRALNIGRDLKAEIYELFSKEEALQLARHFEAPDGARRQAMELASRAASLKANSENVFPSDQEKIIEDIYRQLKVMNQTDLWRVDYEFRKIYGANLDSTFVSTMSNGKSLIPDHGYRAPVEFALRGRDKQTSHSHRQSMTSAAGTEDQSFFQSVVTGIPESDRHWWLQNGGEKILRQHFFRDVSNPMRYLRVLVDGELDVTLKQVRGYVELGEASTFQLVRDNTHWHGDNESEIARCLRTMSDQQRDLYRRGRALHKADREKEANLDTFGILNRTIEKLSRNPADKRALEYYTKLNEALDDAAGKWFSDDSEAAERLHWEDLILFKGKESFLAQLAPHVGCVMDSRRRDVLATMRSMTEEQWKALKSDPESQERVYKILSLLRSSSSEPAIRLFNQMMMTSTFADATISEAPILTVLEDARNLISRNNYQLVFRAIEFMTEQDRKNYKQDLKFRKEVDDAVCGLLATDAQKAAARDLLEQIAMNPEQPPRRSVFHDIAAERNPHPAAVCRKLNNAVKDGRFNVLDHKFLEVMLKIFNDKDAETLLAYLTVGDRRIPLATILRLAGDNAEEFMTCLETATEADRRAALSQMNTDRLPFSEAQNMLIKNILENGMKPEYLVRSYVLKFSNITDEQVLKTIGALSDQEKLRVRGAYPEIMNELRASMGAASYSEAKYLMLPEPQTPQGWHLRALQRYQETASMKVADNLGWDGSLQGLHATMNQFERDMIDNPGMTLAQVKERYERVCESARSVATSQDQAFSLVYDSICLIASLYMCNLGWLAKLATAGAQSAGKVGLRQHLVGEHLNTSPTTDFVVNWTSYGTNFLGGQHLAYCTGLARKASTNAANTIAKGLGKEELGKQLQPLIARALLAGHIRGVEKEVEQVVKEVFKGLGKAQVAAFEKKALALINDNVHRKFIFQRMVLSPASCALTGGATSFTGAMTGADIARQGFLRSFEKACEAGAEGAAIGARMHYVSKLAPKLAPVVEKVRHH